MSIDSVMLVGGVQEEAEEKPNAANSMHLEVMVVIDGAVCDKLLVVVCPPSASTGVVVSTPTKAVMPPALPVDAENDHAWLAASPPTAKRQ
jgi:hypothetical protein